MDRLQLLLRFGYVGDRFYGLQPQPDLPTAGGALRARLEEAAGCRARGLAFAARTDAGVHALQNLATAYFRGGEAGQADALLAHIAAPRDDGLFSVTGQVVPRHVHARGSSAGKRYRYIVDAGCDPAVIAPETRSAVGRPEAFGRFSWRIAPALDVERMRVAARAFAGRHDFSAFRGPGCSASTPVKELVHVGVRGPYPLGEHGASRVFIELVGDAFLRKMVRLLVGLLVEVGTGLRAPTEAGEVLETRVRPAGALVAPARGLTLVRVGCTWPSDGSGLLPGLLPSVSARDASAA